MVVKVTVRLCNNKIIATLHTNLLVNDAISNSCGIKG